MLNVYYSENTLYLIMKWNDGKDCDVLDVRNSGFGTLVSGIRVVHLPVVGVT